MTAEWDDDASHLERRHRLPYWIRSAPANITRGVCATALVVATGGVVVHLMFGVPWR